MGERPAKHVKEMTAEELRAIERACMAAIGWVQGGANEANHYAAKEITERLTIAAIHYERKALAAQARAERDAGPG